MPNRLAAGGFALLSRLALEADERHGSLHALTVRGVDLTRELQAVSDCQHAPSGLVAAFWDWLDDRALARGGSAGAP